MITVKNEGNDTLEYMIRKFKKLVEKEGIIKEVKDRRYYVKPNKKKHIEKKHQEFEQKKHSKSR